MTNTTYHPSPLVPVHRQRSDDGWTLVFTRDLPHAPEAVWRALTSPDQLRQWSPYTAEHELTAEGAASLSMLDGGGGEPAASMDGTVRRYDRPRLLEHAFGDDALRWELTPIEDGTRLVLRHTFAGRDGDWASALAAGWHLCLDVADALLAGAPFGPIVGDQAREYGWDELNERYAKVLGAA
ncbi:SRPBCC family protein [Pseudonocardia acaciae]|uniref:SRPBCC family protein n=1 Tax=Pseudonocardia acaciae TaxID=551276 RepID=UPI00048FE354|nr:SRPBCC family protein [Pseudonocardia acaciae]